jgi:hypothetical protein
MLYEPAVVLSFPFRENALGLNRLQELFPKQFWRMIHPVHHEFI